MAIYISNFSTRFLILCLALLITLSSCSLLNDDGSVNLDFEEAQQKWEEKNISDYTITVDRHCFCGVGSFPAKIVVKSDTISQVLKPNSNEVIPVDTRGEAFNTYEDVYPTINSLFDLIENAQNNADQYEVTYNSELGFPKKVDIDFVEQAADDEIRYDVKSFSK